MDLSEQPVKLKKRKSMADGGGKPLQSAMKMAKQAIQLEGGDRQQVGGCSLDGRIKAPG